MSEAIHVLKDRLVAQDHSALAELRTSLGDLSLWSAQLAREMAAVLLEWGEPFSYSMDCWELTRCCLFLSRILAPGEIVYSSTTDVIVAPPTEGIYVDGIVTAAGGGAALCTPSTIHGKILRQDPIMVEVYLWLPGRSRFWLGGPQGLPIEGNLYCRSLK